MWETTELWKVSIATFIDPLVTTSQWFVNWNKKFYLLNKWLSNFQCCVLFVGLLVDLRLHNSSECFESSEETLRFPDIKSRSTTLSYNGYNTVSMLLRIIHTVPVNLKYGARILQPLRCVVYLANILLHSKSSVGPTSMPILCQSFSDVLWQICGHYTAI
jgi:hypothetical protein